MAVYLDDANIAWRGKRWCHLFADSLPDLEQFARQVGLKEEWLQNAIGEGLPHYDVTGEPLSRCRELGAVSVVSDDGTYRRLRDAMTRGEYVLKEER